MMTGNRLWTEAEYTSMCNAFADGKTLEQVSELLGRTMDAIKIKRWLRCPPSQVYRSKLDYAMEHGHEFTMRQLSEQLGVCVSTVWTWCNKYGIKPLPGGHAGEWSDLEMKILRSNAGKLRAAAMAKLLQGRSAHAVRTKACWMGVSLRLMDGAKHSVYVNITNINM